MPEPPLRRRPWVRPAVIVAPCPPLPAAVDVDEMKRACFIVRDHNGQALGFVYFEDDREALDGQAADPRRSPAHPANIAKLPELLRQAELPKARCDEVAAAHFTIVRAMSA